MPQWHQIMGITSLDFSPIFYMLARFNDSTLIPASILLSMSKDKYNCSASFKASGSFLLSVHHKQWFHCNYSEKNRFGKTSIKWENCIFCGKCYFLFFPPKILAMLCWMSEYFKQETQVLISWLLIHLTNHAKCVRDENFTILSVFLTF